MTFLASGHSRTQGDCWRRQAVDEGSTASGSLGSCALPAAMHATVGNAAAIEAATLLRSVTVLILQRHPPSGVDQHGFLWEPELVLGRTYQ